jgi:hypothetical protein
MARTTIRIGLRRSFLKFMSVGARARHLSARAAPYGDEMSLRIQAAV